MRTWKKISCAGASTAAEYSAVCSASPMSRFRAYDEETVAEAAPSAAWAPDDEDSSSFEPVTPLK